MIELNKIYQGDSLEVLKTFPDKSVNCCITSPPYWGLRDYGTATWVGGDADCKHEKAKEKSRYDYSLATSPIQDGERKGTDAPKWKNICPTCGAKKIDKQLGLEETPEEYVQKIVELFREVRRCLKDDGTLWLNLGDSYAASGGKQVEQTVRKSNDYVNAGQNGGQRSVKNNPIGIKMKDLIGIPWMVAFALRADGWYLRQDIIWSKKNCMPESVTDRCTKSHEYIFLLSKSSKYYYDHEVIKEKTLTYDNGLRDRDNTKLNNTPGRSKMLGLKTNKYEFANKRSVWETTLVPFNEAHFATFPEDLITPMVKAGCPKNGLVLDPFMGAGTTGLVAYNYNRNYVGIELNPEYIKIAENRIKRIVSRGGLRLIS